MRRTTLYTSVSNFFARARVVLHGGGLTYYICSTSASFAVLLWKAFCFPIKCSFIYIWQYYVPRILFLFLPFLKIHKMPTFYWKGSEHSIYLDWTRIFKLLINIHMALKIGPALKLCSRPRAWLMRPSAHGLTIFFGWPYIRNRRGLIFYSYGSKSPGLYFLWSFFSTLLD